MAKWNMVGATEPVSQEKLLAKQRTIEGRMQTVRGDTAREVHIQ